MELYGEEGYQDEWDIFWKMEEIYLVREMWLIIQDGIKYTS